jgi:hypothetical protein
MPSDRRRFLHQAATAGLGLRLSAADGQPVVCRVVDRESRRGVAARVRLLDARGNEVVPLGHSRGLAENAQEGDVRFQSRRYAYVNGEFTVDPAWLPLKYQVLKGYEYQIAEGELPAAAPRAGAFTIPLSRWSSLSRQAWYSGDIHIHHIAPRTCRLEMDAEDLNVANILTSDFTQDQKEFEGRLNGNSSRDRLVYVTQEFRHDQLGHLCVLNLKKLIEPVKTMQKEHYPLNLRACDLAHAQGGYVSWAHFPSMPCLESPLDVAMEKLDGLEVLCVLDPRTMPVFMKQIVPEFESNHGLRMWYRYLNCGFRLTATAGTDKMTTFVTVGANRVYARVDGEFTYQSWIDALKQGRTFITNSPLLTFTVNGREAGSTLAVSSARDKVVRIHAKAESQLPYDRLEIVSNGSVIAEASPSGARHKAEIHLEHPLGASCWIAARATEDQSRYRALDFQQVHNPQGTLLSSLYGTRRPEAVFAHSSPVYVVRDGRPVRSFDDAQYYIRYLDNSIRWLKENARFASPSDKQASIEAFERGRAIYAQRAGEAGQRGSSVTTA